jgi:hypothetical protein
MRAFSTLVALWAIPLILASSDKGSLDALLERVSNRTHKALPVDAIPSDLASSKTTTVTVVKDAEESPVSSKVGKGRLIVFDHLALK